MLNLISMHIWPHGVNMLDGKWNMLPLSQQLALHGRVVSNHFNSLMQHG